jgi:hypothetical protein
MIGNATYLSILNVNGSSNILNSSTFLSKLTISNTSSINGTVTFLSNILISGNSTFNNNITIGSLLNNTNINGQIVCSLPEYLTNNDATINNIPTWGFYRTGGIIKIRLNQISPTINLLGDSSIDINISNNYIDPGAYAIDPGDGNIPVYLSLLTGTTSLISNILITGTSTLITKTSTLLTGNYTALYTATNSSGLISNNYRLINIITPTP